MRPSLSMALLQTHILAVTLLLPPAIAVSSSVWKAGIDWTAGEDFDFEAESFTTPGVIFPGYTFKGTVDVFGQAWTANSPSEIVGLFCVHYGPLVFTLVGEEQSIKDTCNNFVDSLRKFGDISEVEITCDTEWDDMELGMDENSTLFTIDECYTDAYLDFGAYFEISSSDVDYAADIVAGVYSTCAGGYGLGTDRLSAVAFAVLDWLGSSVLSIANITGGDPRNIAFAKCSLMRYILSMNMKDLVDEIVTLGAYPAADLLEYLQYLQICDKRTANVDHSEGFNFIFDWLLIFTGRDALAMCNFFSSRNTREEYMDEGVAIAQRVHSVLTNKAICMEVMAKLGETNARDDASDITGYDIVIASERQALCDDITIAMTTSSITDLTIYKLPDKVNLDDVEPFATTGEFLPGFTFKRLLTFAGALYRSTTVTKALEAVCYVWEMFYIDNDVFEGVDVDGICDTVRKGDLADMEQLCLTEIFSDIFKDDPYPLALRTFDMAMVAADTARRMLNLEMFSKGHLCKAIDSFVHSKYNLYSIVAFALEGFLDEGLVSANSICKSYDEVLCYLGHYCNPVEAYQQTEQNDFITTVANVEDIVLLAMGYPSRTSLCKAVSDGLNAVSGRPTELVKKKMRSKILRVMEDRALCTDVLDQALRVVSEEIDSAGEIMFTVTGMNSTSEVCGFVTTKFPSHGILSAQASLLLAICAVTLGIFVPL